MLKETKYEIISTDVMMGKINVSRQDYSKNVNLLFCLKSIKKYSLFQEFSTLYRVNDPKDQKDQLECKKEEKLKDFSQQQFF
ncbi:unnamed protein product (macronuclear) [Paramecium tetraurelia]|uniref:Uncharacterized protein n=1 Tax=Paramecium tetraurelia TaxID=5888 RepID=A0D2A1_PARTE|nr:uncharacterized protein GSPATT00012674001 [Paramecium tetraurelia]CAK77168.1 unnamed protein product [Paramecium tetraurelia]|eukprot:XP_001444565.1 hypothetical protein (macronuclear) [Paramecium tetraurelia strain d4-2]